MLIILIAMAGVAITATNIPKAKAAATTVAISKVYGMNQTGTTFLINITVSDVTGIYGWVMNLEWNPDMIKVTTGDPEGLNHRRANYNIYQGDFMQSASRTYFLVNSIDNNQGTIKALACAFTTTGYTVSGSGLLASINFTLLDVGTTAINFTGPSISQPGHSILQSRSGEEIPHSIINGLVTDQPPPPPPPIWAESWFQNLVVAVIAVFMLVVVLPTGVVIKLRNTPPLTDEELEKLGEYDEEIEGEPLPEDSE